MSTGKLETKGGKERKRQHEWNRSGLEGKGIMGNRIADKNGREEQQMESKGEQFEVEGRII